MALFAASREEDLNLKTINKHVIVMLQAMRRAGATSDDELFNFVRCHDSPLFGDRDMIG